MTHKIVRISNGADGASVFEEVEYLIEQRGGMFISEQQQALNFRHRTSPAGYASDWHVAGDPTLIMISQGVLRLELRNGNFKDFGPGDQFIAADYTSKNSVFNPVKHGHRAQVIGENELVALHLKLEKR